MPDVVGHFESHLGVVEKGWNSTPNGARLPFQVVKYARGSHDDDHAYSTLGLSDHRLGHDQINETTQTELLFLLRNGFRDEIAVEQLAGTGMRMLAQHRSLLSGQVIATQGSDMRASGFVGLVAAHPAYFDDSFSEFVARDGGGALVTWLIPLKHEEMHFILDRGWVRFEDVLMAQDPDLTDQNRLSTV
ncbi:suppressor of fused domain protein [Solicola sp. PLA-1-18]|uniref:suppressor of fused domain protein n=1 Tax=Solicola sp. PLA-1-18 TaxID=3380532 RepID=UPI003B814FC8